MGAPEKPPPAGPSRRPAGSALLTRRTARRRGKMAQEAGDMEDGQLFDSDSDMTVAPSDRPLQVPVSEKGGREVLGPARGALAAEGGAGGGGGSGPCKPWAGISLRG